MYSSGFHGDLQILAKPRKPPYFTFESSALNRTQPPFLYGRYYVPTFAGGKEKWTSLKTKLLSAARKPDERARGAAQRQRSTGNVIKAVGRLTFGEALGRDREQLSGTDVRPNTKAYREAGVKVVPRTWSDVQAVNVRRITSNRSKTGSVDSRRRQVPYVPRGGAKSPSRNSGGASVTNIESALAWAEHFLFSRQVVNAAQGRGFDEDTLGVLEGSGGDERFGLQRGLGDAEEPLAQWL